MSWFVLILAGLFEVGFTFCMSKMKGASGGEMYLWLVGFLFSLFMSMALLFKATQSVPLGTAYVVWTGIGAVGTVLLSIILFKEPVNFWKIFFIITLTASIVGLKAVSVVK